MCRVHTIPLQTNIVPAMKIYVRDYINTCCMAYICDMPIIPCIHTPINTYVQSWVFAIHIIYRTSIHGLQVYRSTAKCLQTRSTDPYTCSIQLVYTGIQVYRSTGLQVYSLRIPQEYSQEAVYGIQSTVYTEYTGAIQLLSWYQVYSGIQVYSHPFEAIFSRVDSILGMDPEWFSVFLFSSP